MLSPKNTILGDLETSPINVPFKLLEGTLVAWKTTHDWKTIKENIEINRKRFMTTIIPERFKNKKKKIIESMLFLECF
ncbi:hypothetical protein LPTSP2_15280 [Leptospira ellinghausenii]|uniref:Uncharacterized protein n=1 Tax=Leptospira ellinghausenii TaxID=1917822 RepID=A0A2P2DC77_9LEPT|nr:hypothetical protein LPTSP2_15280 [Leptospira ellinghausenii]